MLFANRINGVTDELCDDVFTAMADYFEDPSEWEVYRETYRHPAAQSELALVWEDVPAQVVEQIMYALDKHGITGVAWDKDIYTYTADMDCPSCPECGARVEQQTDQPERVWRGTCGHDHVFLYQLDVEEEENQ